MKTREELIDDIVLLGVDIDTAAKLYESINQMVYNERYKCKKLNVTNEVNVAELVDILGNYLNKSCKYCSELITDDNISIDHIESLTKMTRSSVDNIQFICYKCNYNKNINNNVMAITNAVNALDEIDKKYVLEKVISKILW